MKKSKILMYAVCAFMVAAPLFSAFAGNTGERRSPIISGNVNPALKTPITLNAHEASLSEVLRVLATNSGMNFVVGEGVSREKITIILNNTPLDEAINLLVRASGLSYEIIGNSILIAQPDFLKTDVGLSAYVVELKYAKADEVAAALKNLTPNIQIDKGGNRLICYASPRIIMEIERIVQAIDRPHILVLLETRLIEVSVDRLNQYGIQWQSMSPEMPFDIGAMISIPEAPIGSAFSFSGATRGPININAAIDLMVQNGDGRILMDSKLTTTNNREASLHIGEIVPYVIQTFSGSGANQQIEKENVGVLLTMTPHINGENQITLTLAPEVSNIIGWKGANADIPVVRTRKTSTTVRVENGQTVILAGLLSEEQTQTTHKVPVLGDIPVLGLLFQNKRNEVRKTNLIIEVVPRIINDPAEISKYMSMQMDPRRFGHQHGGERGRGRGHGHHRSAQAQQPAAAAPQQPVIQEASAAQPEPVAEEVYYADVPAAPLPAPVSDDDDGDVE